MNRICKMAWNFGKIPTAQEVLRLLKHMKYPEVHIESL